MDGGIAHEFHEPGQYQICNDYITELFVLSRLWFLGRQLSNTTLNTTDKQQYDSDASDSGS